MPFGMYSGCEVRNLPNDYLCWLHNEAKNITGYIADAIDAEYRSRGFTDAEVPLRVKEIIEAGFKALAFKHHPDVGGHADAMRELLEARAWLQRLIPPDSSKDN